MENVSFIFACAIYLCCSHWYRRPKQLKCAVHNVHLGVYATNQCHTCINANSWNHAMPPTPRKKIVKPMHTHALVHINTYDFALFQQMIAICIESFIRLQLYYMRLVHAINLPCDCTERARENTQNYRQVYKQVWIWIYSIRLNFEREKKLCASKVAEISLRFDFTFFIRVHSTLVISRHTKKKKQSSAKAAKNFIFINNDRLATHYANLNWHCLMSAIKLFSPHRIIH